MSVRGTEKQAGLERYGVERSLEKCPTCGKTFLTAQQRAGHEQTHRDEGDDE
jgi:hypothetical protein